MSALARFEQFVSTLVEGSMARLFNAALQPVEIARQLGRVMDDQALLGPQGRIGPTRFQVSLHTEDFAALAGQPATKAAIERELARYLQEEARERGLVLREAPVVRLGEDARAPVHRPLISAEFAPEAPAAVTSVDHTVALPSIAPAATPAPQQPGGIARPAAELVLVGGSDAGPQRFVIGSNRINLGRARDNDVLVLHERVSRHHAEILYSGGRYYVHDLGSRNGTYVNGRKVQTHLLQDGDQISVGGVNYIFRGS